MDSSLVSAGSVYIWSISVLAGPWLMVISSSTSFLLCMAAEGLFPHSFHTEFRGQIFSLCFCFVLGFFCQTKAFVSYL